MKRFKVILMTVAIIIAVTGAFATSAAFNCQNQPQWYLGADTEFHLAGTAGVHYTCEIMPATFCTYVFNGTDFVGCVLGRYKPL